MAVSARLVVLAGPTAVGKGTVAAYIREHYPEVWLSVSATTRPPRPGEVDGVHYYFMTDDEFAEMAANGGFLEHAIVHGRASYGTPKAPVEQAIADGRLPLLEIDLQGARQVKQNAPDAFFVFLAPPRDREGRTRGAERVRPRHRQRRCSACLRRTRIIDENT